MLKDESALANLFEDEEIILGADDGLEQKSIDSFDFNKELNEKSGINEPKNGKASLRRSLSHLSITRLHRSLLQIKADILSTVLLWSSP